MLGVPKVKSGVDWLPRTPLHLAYAESRWDPRAGQEEPEITRIGRQMEELWRF